MDYLNDTDIKSYTDPTDDQQMDNNQTTAHDHSNMIMYFHGGMIETILVSPWKTDTITVFILSWIIIFIFSFLYEGIREFRLELELEQRSIDKSAISTAAQDKIQTQELQHLTVARIEPEKYTKQKNKVSTFKHILLSVLYLIQIGLSYLLMLVAMTFNLYLFIAILFGMGTGYFVYGLARQQQEKSLKNQNL